MNLMSSFGRMLLFVLESQVGGPFCPSSSMPRASVGCVSVQSSSRCFYDSVVMPQLHKLAGRRGVRSIVVRPALSRAMAEAESLDRMLVGGNGLVDPLAPGYPDVHLSIMLWWGLVLSHVSMVRAQVHHVSLIPSFASVSACSLP